MIAARKVFEGIHATVIVHRLAPSLVLVRIQGNDVGELGDAPLQALEQHVVHDGRVELFIDARDGRTASIDVSNEWARWLRAHRDALVEVHMLTSTRFIRLTAEFVRRFAELGETMQISTDPAAFDDRLTAAVRRSRR